MEDTCALVQCCEQPVKPQQVTNTLVAVVISCSLGLAGSHRKVLIQDASGEDSVGGLHSTSLDKSTGNPA